MSRNTKKYIKTTAIALAGAFFLSSYAEARANNTNCQGNLVLEQEGEAGKVAFYEDDVKYLEMEIRRLQSQLGN